MTSRFVSPFYDVGSGIKPPSGAKLFFFEGDGVTPKDTHTTKAGVSGEPGNLNANPVIADSVGIFPNIYITGDYLVTLKDKNLTQIFGLAPVSEFATISDSAFVKSFDTLALAAADSSLVFDVPSGKGDTLNLKERASGTGGGGVWDVVLTSTVTPNTYNIVISTANASLSLVLRIGPVINADQWGVNIGDGTVAFNFLLGFITSGAIVDLYDTTYAFTDRLLITNAATSIRIGAGTTVDVSGYSYNGTQDPFGNQFHITADRCSVTGQGDSSLIAMGVTDANAIGFLHCDQGKVSKLRITGNKSNNLAIIDDTFQSGISIVNTVEGNATGIGQYTIDDVTIEKFTQYGINMFGDKVLETSIHNCRIHDMGNTGEAESVGAGIVMTFGVTQVAISNCVIRDNKNKGIFQSSAGRNSLAFSIVNNQIHDNGLHGISFTEESNFGSVVAIGTSKVTITGNNVYGNSSHGILIGTFDDVGFMRDVTVTGNTCSNNGSFGLLILTNDDPTNRTSDITATGNNLFDNDFGLGIGANIDFDVAVEGNNIRGNTTAAISNSGRPTGIKTAWTPIPIGSTVDGTVTISSAIGSYIRHTDGRIDYDFLLDYNTFTGTGNLLIDGLPYTASASEPASISGNVWANGLAMTGTVILRNSANSTVLNVDAINNGSFSSVAVDAAATIRASGTYLVDL